MSSSLWVLERDLCRCCHAEGSFCNLDQPYKEGGLEMYSEILKDCFNIEMCPAQGQLYALTQKICQACISRLEDAYHFKKQVVDCERKFIDMYKKGVINVLEDALVTVVKEEVSDTSIDFSLPGSDLDEDDAVGKLEIDEEDEPKLQIVEETPSPSLSLPEEPELQIVEETETKEKSEPVEKEKRKPARRVRKRKVEKTDEKQSQEKKKGSETDQKFTKARQKDGTCWYTCKSCQRVYKTRTGFSQHYKGVHLKLQPKLRSCLLCPVKVSPHMRRFHMEEAHGVPAPTCNACGKKFGKPFQVLRHQRIYHMGEKKYSCATCDMAFSTNYHRKEHEKKHSQTKPFQCELCNKSFRWKNNLKTHVMMHLGVRKQVCPVCKQSFVQHTSLKYHMMTRHPDAV